MSFITRESKKSTKSWHPKGEITKKNIMRYYVKFCRDADKVGGISRKIYLIKVASRRESLSQ